MKTIIKIRTILALTSLSGALLLTGCGSTQPTASPSSAYGAASNNSAASTAQAQTQSEKSAQTASQAKSASGANNTSTGDSNGSGQSSSSGPTSNAASTDTSPASRSGATTVTVATPSLVLFPLTLKSDDIVTLRGQLHNASGNTPVAIYAVTAKGMQIASAYVSAAPDGLFHGSLNVSHAGPGPHHFYFGAYYPGAVAQGMRIYLPTLGFTNGFPSVVASAMADAGSFAGFPVQGPAWLPQSLSASEPSYPYVSAVVFGKPIQYTMQFYATQAQNPLNTPSTQNSKNLIGWITGDQFATAKAADAYVHDQLPAHAATGQTATLDNQTGYTYGHAGSGYVVRWREGDWTLEVAGPSLTQDLAQARKVVAALDTLFLPPTTGSVLVRNIATSAYPKGGVSTQTNISFAWGRDAYSVTTVGAITRALHMAASMKP